MSKPCEYHLTAHHIAAVETSLSKGHRTMIVPVKDGIRVFEVTQKEIGQVRQSGEKPV